MPTKIKFRVFVSTLFKNYNARCVRRSLQAVFLVKKNIETIRGFKLLAVIIESFTEFIKP